MVALCRMTAFPQKDIGYPDNITTLWTKAQKVYGVTFCYLFVPLLNIFVPGSNMVSGGSRAKTKSWDQGYHFPTGKSFQWPSPVQSDMSFLLVSQDGSDHSPNHTIILGFNKMFWLDDFFLLKHCALLEREELEPTVVAAMAEPQGYPTVCFEPLSPCKAMFEKDFLMKKRWSAVLGCREKCLQDDTVLVLS